VKGFRAFLLRGNLVDLAVAVVVGVAFNAVIQSLVSDFITPLIAAFGGQPNFAALTFTVNKSTFHYGAFLNELISFVIVAAVVYFIVVAPVDRVLSLASRKKAATERACPECLNQIAIAATRCMYCTATVPPVPAPAPAAGTAS
jgi:large conductance mechanosensitive channel